MSLFQGSSPLLLRGHSNLGSGSQSPGVRCWPRRSPGPGEGLGLGADGPKSSPSRELLSLGNSREAGCSGPLSECPMIATGAYDTTGGFSKAASGAVNAREVAAAVVALNTCQHVPATGETKREALKIESRRKIGQYVQEKTTTGQTSQLSYRLKHSQRKKHKTEISFSHRCTHHVFSESMNG